MEAILNAGWLCGECGQAMVVNIEGCTPTQTGTIQCANQDCREFGTIYHEPRVSMELEQVAVNQQFSIESNG